MPAIDQVFLDATIAAQGKAALVANGLARDVDRSFQRAWSKFQTVMMEHPEQAAKDLGSELTDDVFRLIRDRLRATAIDAWNDQARAVYRNVPLPLLTWLAQRHPRPGHQESTQQGGLVLGLHVASGGRPETSVRLAELRRVFFGSDPTEVKPELLGLFQPPSPQEVDAAIFATSKGLTWPERLKRWENAEDIATEIRSGIIAGDSRQAIARRIMPLVDENRVAAMRIARTETHRITVQMQMESARQTLGDALTGWRYTATLDDRTQPEHGALDGTIYSVDDASRPELPQRPNCRCVYAPATKTLEDLGLPKEIADLFQPRERAQWTGGSKLRPGKRGVRTGALDYGSWFDDQPEETKRFILSPGRYDRLKATARGPVKWTKALQTFGTRPPDTIQATIDAWFVVPSSPPPPPPPPPPADRY